jgi:hypothetical protein
MSANRIQSTEIKPGQKVTKGRKLLRAAQRQPPSFEMAMARLKPYAAFWTLP